MNKFENKVNNHLFIDEITEYLCVQTSNTDKNFFNNMLCYYLGKMVSMLHVKIKTEHRGEIPINIYSIALATSGYGKGFSKYLIEENLFKRFKNKFISEILPKSLYANIQAEAYELSNISNIDHDSAIKELEEEANSYGGYVYTFDSATVAAIKQMRNLIVLSDTGSLNLEADEIGANIHNLEETLSFFLELYDQGLAKDKLLKNNINNKRLPPREGKTPANILLFGTPVKLLDGSYTENLFYSLLDSGYARRCLFSLGNKIDTTISEKPEDIYIRRVQQSSNTNISRWENIIYNLCNIDNLNRTITLPRDIGILSVEYEQYCKKRAEELSEHESVFKNELIHRYYKSLKLAGAFTFLNGKKEIGEEEFLQAIKIVEESGKSLKDILKRDPTHVKLAKYIANSNTPLSFVNLMENLPFFKGSKHYKEEQISLAQAWGIENNIIIKRSIIQDVDFFEANIVKISDKDRLIISESKQLADNYIPLEYKFKDLVKLGTTSNNNFCNHYFRNNSRSGEDVLQEFNTIILDIDGTSKIEFIKYFFKPYYYYVYTTKSHTIDKHHFRIVFPISHKLYLNREEYKTFMNNIFNWLPFTVDSGSGQPEKKWAMHNSIYQFLNDKNVDLLNILKFIPNTSQNNTFNKQTKKLRIKFSNRIEYWFISQFLDGNRNNTLLRYGCFLKDTGYDYDKIKKDILSFNDKMPNSLEKIEIENTVLKTIAKYCNKV